MLKNEKPVASLSAFALAHGVPIAPATERWARLKNDEKLLLLAMTSSEGRPHLRNQTNLKSKPFDALVARTSENSQTLSRPERLSLLWNAPLSEDDYKVICPRKLRSIRNFSTAEKKIADCLASGWDEDAIAFALDVGLGRLRNIIRQMERKIGATCKWDISAATLVFNMRERTKKQDSESIPSLSND